MRNDLEVAPHVRGVLPESVADATVAAWHKKPGDPVARMVDPMWTPEEVEHVISQLGLDQPIWTQYLYYLKNFFSGNFGVSFHYGEPVQNIIWNRLPNTILLFTTSTILAALAGVFLGKIAAWRRGERTDTVMTIGALFCHTLFLPWLALIMIWFFAYWVGWFPITGMVSPQVWIDPDVGFAGKALDVLHHMALPLMTLILIHFGSYLLVMRSSMLDTLKEDYIVTARAKGLDEKTIRNRHAAPNAALPVVTSVGLSLAFSINGGALTETVFTWPGIGRELVFSVSHSDYPLAQAALAAEENVARHLHEELAVAIRGLEVELSLANQREVGAAFVEQVEKVAGAVVMETNRQEFDALQSLAALFLSPVCNRNRTVAPALTWIEMMQKGVPVLTTPVAGTEELIAPLAVDQAVVDQVGGHLCAVHAAAQVRAHQHGHVVAGPQR